MAQVILALNPASATGIIYRLMWGVKIAHVNV